MNVSTSFLTWFLTNKQTNYYLFWHEIYLELILWEHETSQICVRYFITLSNDGKTCTRPPDSSLTLANIARLNIKEQTRQRSEIFNWIFAFYNRETLRKRNIFTNFYPFVHWRVEYLWKQFICLNISISYDEKYFELRIF